MTNSDWNTSSLLHLIVTAGLFFGITITTGTVAAAAAAGGTTTSKVLVHIPFSLHLAEGYDHVQADFGVHTVSSGRSIASYVWYLDEYLCEPISNRTSGYPRSDVENEDVRVEPPYMVISKAGGPCTAVVKARHAQHAGAAALILVDPNCLCSDTDCTTAFPNNSTCHEHPPLLVDDGSAGDISIPTFLIYPLLAAKLHSHLQNSQPALMELQWGIPEEISENRVPQVHLWTMAYDPLVSLEFYVNVRTVAKAFGKALHFVPHYAIVDGTRFHCTDAQPDTDLPCDHLCTNHGRYCTLHATNLSGYAILRETLRRLCIWKHYGEEHPEKYWDYIIYHKQLCSQPSMFNDAQCIEDAFNTARLVDPKVLESCMDDAGDIEEDTSNALFDAELQTMQYSGVHSLPALSIYHKVLPWTSAHSLFDTLCTEYWLSGVTNVPPVCLQCGSCPNTIGCLEKGKCVEFDNEQRHPDTGYRRNKKSKTGSNTKSHGIGWWFFWLVLVASAMGGAYYYYDKHQDQFNWGQYRRSSSSRGALMNEYMHLPGEG